MMSYVIDGVLLLALLLTSLRVGAMYRELKRLRGYQGQYVEVFGETSRAADHIGDAVRHLGKEGRDVLERLEALIEEAREPHAPARSRGASAERGRAHGESAQSDDVGTYSRRVRWAPRCGEADSLRFKNEILKFAGDNRRTPGQARRGGRGHDAIACNQVVSFAWRRASRRFGQRVETVDDPDRARPRAIGRMSGRVKDRPAMPGECGGT